MYYYVRSQPFADRAAAISAAAAAREKAKSFVNPVAIDYIVVSDAATAPAVQAAGR
jgi:nitrogen fixation protein FixH